jgi:hypothetical protein
MSQLQRQLQTGQQPTMLPFTATSSPGVKLMDPGTPVDAPTTAMSTAELDQHLTAILGAMDPLDAAEFDPIEYINAIFPSGTQLYQKSADTWP